MNDGDSPAKGESCGHSYQRLLGDADIDKPAVELGRQGPQCGPVFGCHDHKTLILIQNIFQHALIIHLFHLHGLSYFSSLRLFRNSSTSSREKEQNQQSVRFSMAASPFPLTVSAMTIFGLPGSKGTVGNTSSISLKLCPSIVRTASPKERNFCSSGSSGIRSSVAQFA